MCFAISCVCAIFFLNLVVAPALGRKLENWPYERLFKNADLVVIAIAEGTADTKDRFKPELWKVEFIGQETTFSVRTILKGKVKGDKINVLHYRLPEDALVKDGPLLVSFRAAPLPLKGTVNGRAFKAELGKPEYMVFLRRRPDGRFEPISGQVDSALSVRELHSPDSLLSELGHK
jgi:hypothetical protein